MRAIEKQREKCGRIITFVKKELFCHLPNSYLLQNRMENLLEKIGNYKQDVSFEASEKSLIAEELNSPVN